MTDLSFGLFRTKKSIEVDKIKNNLKLNKEKKYLIFYRERERERERKREIAEFIRRNN